MEIEISKELPDFRRSPFNDKRVVIVKFPGCSFKWLPTYRQLSDIQKALSEIEQESWGGKEVKNDTYT